jgi:hypothetical protein
LTNGCESLTIPYQGVRYAVLAWDSEVIWCRCYFGFPRLGSEFRCVAATIWAAKPDIDAFEKLENDRLARAQKAITTMIAVKGIRTIQNTLVSYDEAILQLNNASYYARLVESISERDLIRAQTIFREPTPTRTCIFYL